GGGGGAAVRLGSGDTTARSSGIHPLVSIRRLVRHHQLFSFPSLGERVRPAIGAAGQATARRNLPECGKLPHVGPSRPGCKPPPCGSFPHSGKPSTAAPTRLPECCIAPQQKKSAPDAHLTRT